nr:minichromosome maintenance complex component 6-like [Cryptomonas sp.]
MDTFWKHKEITYKYDLIGEEVKRVFYNFLKYFNPENVFFSKKTNSENFFQISKNISQKNSSKIYINFEDLVQFSDELSDIIQEQYVRVELYIRNSIVEFVKRNFNKKLACREYLISFYNIPNKKKFKYVNSEILNKLISISGVVTRLTETYPKLLFATFECSNVSCNFKAWHVVQNFSYIEPKVCTICGNSNWTLIPKDSIFADFQKLRIQEINQKFNKGQNLRTLDLYLRDDHAEIIKPGDRFIFTGSLIVLSTNKLSSQINYRYYSFDNDLFFKSFENSVKNQQSNFCFLVSHLHSYDHNSFKRSIYKKKFSKAIIHLPLFSRRERDVIFNIRNKTMLLANCVNSFDVNDIGNEDLKIAILSMFIGGVKKCIVPEVNLRKNLNICIIDRLSPIKNSLLSNLFKFFPRTLYVNGQNSTAAGLTASTFKDWETNETFIEAGALLFSNKGICFIDNYNKLNQKCQILINDVIERQIISVFKFGMKATIKAETSVLATVQSAIKKNFGSKKQTMSFLFNNFNYSRFDLFFFISDSCSESKDYQTSINIISRNFKKNYNNSLKKYVDDIRFYLCFVKLMKPLIKKKCQKLIINSYRFLRKHFSVSVTYLYKINIRQLESLIKLSEAFSKFFLNLFIEEFHVKAAIRLITFSLLLYDSSKYVLLYNIGPLNLRKENDYNLSGFYSCKKSKTNLIKKNIAINFKEFHLIHKHIVEELDTLKMTGTVGISLKKLLLRLIKIPVLVPEKNKRINQLIKFAMILKYLIFKRRTLYVIQCCHKHSKNYNINLICLNQ